jgi:lactoylglutathione lyase
MKIKESGIILFLENYEVSVRFYIDRLALPVREQQDDLTIFEFGASYLMVEDKGVASEQEKTRAQNPTVLRIDIQDFNKTIEELELREVQVSVHKHSWGTIGVIIDPEGNRIELKEVA